MFRGSVLVGIRKVEAVADPSVTLTFKLLRGPDGRSMLLTVQNPLPYSVKYHLDLVDPRGNLHQTSSCPVMGGGRIGEHWPYPIPQIRISNFHLATADEEKVCIY
jgi:hypothetical protein